VETIAVTTRHRGESLRRPDRNATAPAGALTTVEGPQIMATNFVTIDPADTRRLIRADGNSTAWTMRDPDELGLLKVNRNASEAIVINGETLIVIDSPKTARVQLLCIAPRHVRITRAELLFR
jgi:hypothetical protein